MARFASIVFCVLIGVAFASDARDPAVVADEAKTEVAAELAECSAYY